MDHSTLTLRGVCVFCFQFDWVNKMDLLDDDDDDGCYCGTWRLCPPNGGWMCWCSLMMSSTQVGTWCTRQHMLNVMWLLLPWLFFSLLFQWPARNRNLLDGELNGENPQPDVSRTVTKPVHAKSFCLSAFLFRRILTAANAKAVISHEGGERFIL